MPGTSCSYPRDVPVRDSHQPQLTAELYRLGVSVTAPNIQESQERMDLWDWVHPLLVQPSTGGLVEVAVASVDRMIPMVTEVM